jgi:glycosyltransferase involved in cell wall biosynthesis
MKLLVQIPCWNEEATIAEAIGSMPKSIPGISEIEVIVIDDGSSDATAKIARQCGATVVGPSRHLGLANAFSAGVKAAIERDADILINTDADLQYPSEYIPHLIKPLLDNVADMIIGDRLSHKPAPFSASKMFFQRLGSWFVRIFSGTAVADAASGFRAFNREAIRQLFIHGKFTYTLESLMLAGMKRLRVANVPIAVNPPKRESRLFSSIPGYILRSLITIIRAYLMYHPLKFFLSLGTAMLACSAILGLRYFWYFYIGQGSGHVQSLILLGILAGMGIQTVIMGFIGDVIAANRRLLEEQRLALLTDKRNR